MDMEKFYENALHDIKTPLNVIYSAVQVMETDKNLDGYALKNVSIIKRSCLEMMGLLSDISGSAKMAGKDFAPEYEDEDIVEVIKTIAESAEIYAKAKGIAVELKHDIARRIMAIDKKILERILFNLISNSVKFTESGGKIQIRLYSYQKHIKIAVKDNGCGIEEEKIKEIFDRYNSTDYIKGSGIGLDIVNGFVNLLNGSLKVNSRPQKGVNIEVKLPVFLVGRERGI